MRKIHELYRYIEVTSRNKYGREYTEIYDAKYFEKILKSLRKKNHPYWKISAILYVLEPIDSGKRQMLASKIDKIRK